MSNQRKRDRHQEVLRLRREGGQAFLNGVSRHRNPYNYCDGLQWWQGYDDAAREARQLRADRIKAEQEYEMDERIRRIVREELYNCNLTRSN